MRITVGDYYDGKSSRRQAAELHDEFGMLSVQTGDAKLAGAIPLAEVEISSRIGNTPRYLSFPGGATFECNDNAAIDRLVATYSESSHSGLLHRLESGKRYILASLVLVIAFVWGGITWGIPALAHTAAFAMPASANNLIDKGVLELLDSQMFSTTELPEATQERVLAAFQPIIEGYQGEFQVRVLFRHGGEIGANAMALPSGSIIFTDELVELAETDTELVAILAHELGHVIKRHSLRQALQSTVLGVLVVTITGDISSVSSIVTTLPIILTQLGYSRDFEREADQFSLRVMREQGIDPQNFATILRRIEKAATCIESEKTTTHKGQECDTKATEGDNELSSYLSTHPSTEERLQDFLPPAS